MGATLTNRVRGLHSMAGKAIIVSEFGPSSVLELKAIDPPSPGADEVVVNLKAAGVNPVDTYIRSGSYGRLPTLPYTPGGDGAGVIVSVGKDVAKFKAGDRVWKSSLLNGTYSQFMVLKESGVQPLPDNVSFAQGCAINVAYGTAYRAIVQRARAKPSDRVLIHGGSGGVGLACIQICKYLGITVHATAGSEAGLQLCLASGAEEAFNHREKGYIERMREKSDGGYDVIIEMLANVNLDNDLTMLRRNGRVAVVGNRGTVTIDPRKTMAVDGAILGVAFGLCSSVFSLLPFPLRPTSLTRLQGGGAGRDQSLYSRRASLRGLPACARQGVCARRRLCCP